MAQFGKMRLIRAYLRHVLNLKNMFCSNFILCNRSTSVLSRDVNEWCDDDVKFASKLRLAPLLLLLCYQSLLKL